MLIPLRNKKREVIDYAIVDDDLWSEFSQYNWYKKESGYAARGRRKSDGPGKSVIYMHRLVLGLDSSDLRQGDHINHNRLDNRRGNLRPVTNAQNAQNTKSRGGSSKYRGVSLTKDGKWNASGTLRYHTYHIGNFDKEELAAEAAEAWRKEHMTHA